MMEATNAEVGGSPATFKRPASFSTRFARIGNPSNATSGFENTSRGFENVG